MALYLRARALGAVGLVTAGACALLGTPAAHASSSSASFFSSAGNATIGVSGPGLDIPISVSAGGTPASSYTNVTVSIDTSGLAGVATATTTQSGCTTSGTTITCDLGTMAQSDSELSMMLHLAAVPGAEAGATGQFTLSTWADGIAPTSGSQPTVTLADGPNLRFSAASGDTSAAKLTRGQIYALPQATFGNFGSQNAEGVTIVYYAPYEVPFVNLASNCQYAATADGAGKPTLAVCHFPNVVQPGESDVIETTPQVQVRNDTISNFGGFVQVQAVPGYRAASTVNSALTWINGTGPALTIQPTSGTQTTTTAETSQTDIDPSAEYVAQSFDVTNGVPADLAAVGAAVTGSGGSSVTVTVGAHNDGPGTVDFSGIGLAADIVIFTAPSGTTVTEAPSDCEALTAGVKYRCEPAFGSLLVAGASRNYTFTLAISSSGAHSDGTVNVMHGWNVYPMPSGPDVYDTDWSNDTARVVVNGGPATAPVVALTPNKSAVWKWSGSGTTWTQIGGAASNVYAGAAGIFATSPGNGAIFEYNGAPNSWTRIGGAGAQFVEGGGRLYALTPSKSGVWEWSGNGTHWTQIGGAAATLYVGNDGLFATSPTNGDIFQYSGAGTSWSQVDAPAASVAVSGGTAFALSADKSMISQIGRNTNTIPIGGAASSIYAGGLGLFATSPSTGDIFECLGTTAGMSGNKWIEIGGPGSSFSVGDSALYALTTSKSGVWKWSGSGSTWTQIGGPAAQIAAGD